MNDKRKKSPAALRSTERREREDEAPRLRVYVPDLLTLQLAIIEQSGTSQRLHKKHIIVNTAPALFTIDCGDERCEHGGHDITTHVMSALRSHKATSQGDHYCEGTTGSAQCTRKINFELFAQYATVLER